MDTIAAIAFDTGTPEIDDLLQALFGIDDPVNRKVSWRQMRQNSAFWRKKGRPQPNAVLILEGDLHRPLELTIFHNPVSPLDQNSFKSCNQISSSADEDGVQVIGFKSNS